MKGRVCRLNSLLLPFLLLVFALHASAQVSVIPAADVRFNPEIVLEARVVAVPAADFAKLGIIYIESDTDTDSPLGFAVVLPEDEAQSLIRDPRTASVHSLKLRGTPGNALKFRVDTRVLASENSFAEILPYFEVGMTFEVTPRAFASRNVALSSSTRVQVRQGPAPEGGLAPLVFETQPIKHDIQIPEGKTILLGGFLTASNSPGLPRVPVVPGNPILGYVGTKSPRKGEEPEIVVLLTPRVNGPIEPVAPPPVTAVPATAQPETKVEQPIVVVSALDAAPKLEISTPVTRAMTPSAAPTPPAPVVPAPAPVVKATPAPAPPRPAQKSEARFFTVQVGAFGSSANAESLVAELKKKFEGVFVDHAPEGRTPYRVRVGRLSTLTAARQIQSRLTAQGFEAFVVTPEMP
jgi:cell division septation protein DedD